MKTKKFLLSLQDENFERLKKIGKKELRPINSLIREAITNFLFEKENSE